MKNKADDCNDEMPEDFLRDVERHLARADESADLFYRGCAAYPAGKNANVNAHYASLERRWKNGDKSIVAYIEDGKPYKFEQQLTTEQRERWLGLYVAEALANEVSNDYGSVNERASFFIGLMADHAFGMPVSEALSPPDQKDRKRSIESAAVAFEKFADSLNKLDSAALGWMFAVLEDKAASLGLTIRQGPDVPSLTQSPMRAMVEAGEARLAFDEIAREIGPAMRKAAQTLPLVERNEADPRLHAAFVLERWLDHDGLPFETTETGFAAECLRTMFELAGYDTDRVSYWLKKVADTPDSEVPYFGRVRKFGG